MKHQHYLLWDHDGVLVDTEPWFFEANRRALAELSIELNLPRYMEIMLKGQSAFRLAREAGLPEAVVARHIEKRDEYYQEFLATKDIAVPKVESILAELSRHFAMAIVTTAKRDDFELIHRNRNITGFMDFVLTREDYPRAKPHPDPYLKALKIFGADPDEALVIEDSGRGLQSAVAAGIDCVIIENEFVKTHDFSGAASIVKSIDDLRQVLIPGN